MFPDDFYYETQVLINVLSYDGEVSPDILGTIGASAALSISEIPWNGPVASVRVGRVDGSYKMNPTFEELALSDMEIIISGTNDSIVMVEGSANFISEDDFIECIKYGHEGIKDIIKLQLELTKIAGKTKMEYIPSAKPDKDLIKAIDLKVKNKISSFNKPKEKRIMETVNRMITRIQTAQEKCL